MTQGSRDSESRGQMVLVWNTVWRGRGVEVFCVLRSVSSDFSPPQAEDWKTLEAKGVNVCVCFTRNISVL